MLSHKLVEKGKQCGLLVSNFSLCLKLLDYRHCKYLRELTYHYCWRQTEWLCFPLLILDSFLEYSLLQDWWLTLEIKQFLEQEVISQLSPIERELNLGLADLAMCSSLPAPSCDYKQIAESSLAYSHSHQWRKGPVAWCHLNIWQANSTAPVIRRKTIIVAIHSLPQEFKCIKLLNQNKLR